MFNKLYLLHPVAVHFPIATLTLGLLVLLLSKWKSTPSWFSQAAAWLLCSGTVFLWIAWGLGQVAQNSAPHVPAAWHTMSSHENFAMYTVIAFSVLSIWQLWMKRKWGLAFFILWIVAESLMLTTGFFGGELVFTHGMGTALTGEAAGDTPGQE